MKIRWVMPAVLVGLTLVAGCAMTSGTEERAAAAGNQDATVGPVVVVDTSMGTFKVGLFEEKAPITVKNFLAYVDAKHFDDTVFHRVIPTFMIQGGGFGVEDLKEKDTKEPIKNEATNGLSNKRGTLAMARTGDPDSATAQFFVNVKDNDFLDKAQSQDGFGYAVFGKVTEGMDVVDKIKAVRTGMKELTMKDKRRNIFIKDTSRDVPLENVVIKSIKREK